LTKPIGRITCRDPVIPFYDEVAAF